jgi:hypothetical protein
MEKFEKSPYSEWTWRSRVVYFLVENAAEKATNPNSLLRSWILFLRDLKGSWVILRCEAGLVFLSSKSPVISVVEHDDKATGATYQQTRERQSSLLLCALPFQPCLHS